MSSTRIQTVLLLVTQTVKLAKNRVALVRIFCAGQRMVDYRALVGLQWEYGKQDCYTLVRQYYKLIGVKLPDFPRPEDLGTTDSMVSCVMQSHLNFALLRLTIDRKAIVLVLRLGTRTPMHAAIYVGGDKILHQRVDSISAVEPLGVIIGKGLRLCFVMQLVMLAGELGEKYGKQHEYYNLQTPADAIKLLCINYPALKQELMQAHHNGVGYKVIQGGAAMGYDELQLPFGSKPLLVVPVISGAGGGSTTQILVGVGLVAASFLLPGAGVV